jgi:hypothetical protein
MGLFQLIRDKKIVGTAVYESYRPAKCGMVIADLGPTDGGYFHTLRVRYLKDGVERDIDSGRLNDFNELVADHKRKYENHLATLQKLNRLL